MSEAKKLAVFDIDGTIFRSGVAMEISDRMVRDGHAPAAPYKKVEQAKRSWQNRQSSFEDFAKVFIEYHEHELPGLSVSDFEATASEVIDEMKDRQYRYTRHLVADLRKQGYVLLTITAIFSPALAIYNRYLGFDYALGLPLEVVDGKFTGKETGRSTYRDKAGVLHDFLAEHPELSLDDSYGVGDTESDVGFLEQVAHPIAFNPNKSLYEKAKAEGWKIVVERKDMIYDLTKAGYSVDI